MRQGAKRLEELFQNKNGERFWVEITSTSVMRNGEFMYYLASWIDITEHKKAEEEILISHNKGKTIPIYYSKENAKGLHQLLLLMMLLCHSLGYFLKTCPLL